MPSGDPTTWDSTAPFQALRSSWSLIYLLVRVAGSPAPGKRATIVHMGQLFIVLAVALVAAALVFGITVLIMGGDQGLEPAEPDGRSVPLPGSRPLTESDLSGVQFDVTLRGYRMTQVDQALRRAGYDLGYKEELIGVLEAEVAALRAGRIEEADALREARESAARPSRATDADLDPAAEVPVDAQPIDLDGEPIDLDGPEGAQSDGEKSHRAAKRDEAETSGEATGPTDADAAGADSDRDRDSDRAGRGWPTGVGEMGDAAAVEPAK
ncbi:hypothetical protein GCM10023322_03870 [Rugosimonospora acidiphila]|uniref:DivIVA domain-containing protein n=1 Tax=Rugosimonospora acidiphila TaxID=556531 RepID=A0ABP9RIT0_9ACTN